MSPFDLPEMRRNHWAQPIERQALELSGMILELLGDLNERFETVKCQSGHDHPLNTVCSVEVTSRLACPCGGRIGCANAATHWQWGIKTNGLCPDCDKPARDHWEVLPV